MATTECTTQITLFEVGTQDVTVDFEGGQVVTDAGLLAVRKLDLELGVIAGAAALMPDPRSPERVVHSRERLLLQRVYQVLAGYFDGNDASFLRSDPLFQTLAGVPASSGLSRAAPRRTGFCMLIRDATPSCPSKSVPCCWKSAGRSSNASRE